MAVPDSARWRAQRLHSPSEGWPGSSSSRALQSTQLCCLLSAAPASNEGDAELDSRNREEVEGSWSSESVAVSKIDGLEITPCSSHGMGTSPWPSELSPACSLHLHKTPGSIAAENKEHLKATILLCLAITGIWDLESVVIQLFIPEACVTDVSFPCKLSSSLGVIYLVKILEDILRAWIFWSVVFCFCFFFFFYFYRKIKDNDSLLRVN